jgi:hypothetical protein
MNTTGKIVLSSALVLVIGSMISNGCSDDNPAYVAEETAHATVVPVPATPTEPEPEPEPELTATDELMNFHKALTDTKLEDFKSKDGIILYVGVLNEISKRVTSSKRSANPEEVKTAKKLEKLLVNQQLNHLPVLRKQYAKIMRQALWENDIEVEISGKRNTVLTFTGGMFAANRNIRETQQTLSEVLNLLRFKRVNYKWYEYDDEYTYYDLENAYDAILL